LESIQAIKKGGADYWFFEPAVAGDSVFDCGVFGATCSRPLEPAITRKPNRTAATTPKITTDLVPPLEPSSMSVIGLSAMAIPPEFRFAYKHLSQG
jgi:hypothetical protein